MITLKALLVATALHYSPVPIACEAWSGKPCQTDADCCHDYMFCMQMQGMKYKYCSVDGRRQLGH